MLWCTRVEARSAIVAENAGMTITPDRPESGLLVKGGLDMLGTVALVNLLANVVTTPLGRVHRVDEPACRGRLGWRLP